MNDSLAFREEVARVHTRASLLARLKNADDHLSWKEFFDTYWGLIYRFALRCGLTEDEAVEASQETIITVARKIGGFGYDRRRGQFSSWLFAITYYRVMKLRHRRGPLVSRDHSPNIEDGGSSDWLEQLPDPASVETDTVWQEEWERNALAVATERAKLRANPNEFQLFDYHVVQGHSVEDTAQHLSCAAGTVYSAKRRVVKLIKKEVKRLMKSSAWT